MAKYRAWRNIILVALLFILMGLLVFFARAARTPSLIGPEPEEIQRARLSRTENGYFILREALQNLKPVALTRQVTASDFERGPKAELLDVYLEEDNPELDAAIQASRPVVDAVHRALEMPYLLLPVDWAEVRKNPGIYYGGDFYEVRKVCPRLFLVAADDAQNGQLDGAVQEMVNFHRLTWRLIDEFGLSWAPGASLSQRVALIRECPPVFQERLRDALLELKQQWQPLKYAIDTELRALEIQGLWIIKQAHHGLQNFEVFIELNRATRAMAGKYEVLREVSGYTFKQYREWAAANRELANATNVGYAGFQLEQLCHANGIYLMELDAMCAVLAIEQYKRDNGLYPESLDQLVPRYLPAVPQDPLCDGPFTYRRDGDDYRLYTLGRACKDDGGQQYNSDTRVIHLP